MRIAVVFYAQHLFRVRSHRSPDLSKNSYFYACFPYSIKFILTCLFAKAITLFAIAGQAQDRVIPVGLDVVMAESIYEEILLSGSVMARRVSMLSPSVDGLISKMFVDDGEPVKQGGILVQLDRVLAELEMDQAAAKLEEERARLKEAIRQRDEVVELTQKKYISETTFKRSIADVQMKTAAVKRLDAEYKLQLELVNRHTIKAPFGGVIAKKFVEVGQWVETGTTVFELVDNAVLRIDIPVPQRYFNRIEIGLPVSVELDVFPGKIFEAAVTMKIPVADVIARTFSIRVEINNKDKLMAPGMSARVNLKIKDQSASAVLTVPRDAIVLKADGSEVVWLVIEESGDLHVKPIIVKTGHQLKERVEILNQELQAGDRIVSQGNEILTAGQKVRIVKQR